MGGLAEHLGSLSGNQGILFFFLTKSLKKVSLKDIPKVKGPKISKTEEIKNPETTLLEKDQIHSLASITFPWRFSWG